MKQISPKYHPDKTEISFECHLDITQYHQSVAKISLKLHPTIVKISNKYTDILFPWSKILIV